MLIFSLFDLNQRSAPKYPGLRILDFAGAQKPSKPFSDYGLTVSNEPSAIESFIDQKTLKRPNWNFRRFRHIYPTLFYNQYWCLANSSWQWFKDIHPSADGKNSAPSTRHQSLDQWNNIILLSSGSVRGMMKYWRENTPVLFGTQLRTRGMKTRLGNTFSVLGNSEALASVQWGFNVPWNCCDNCSCSRQNVKTASEK